MRNKMSMALIASSILFTGCSNTISTETGNINETTETSKNIDNFAQNITVDTTVSNADEALEILKQGNERFLNDKSQLRNVSSERRETLKEGQSPYAIILSCSDSRVTPTTVFNAGLGEIFDIRVAGDVVDEDVLGSIEYGVKHLNTPLVVVMGHQDCGAVTAAYNQVVNGEEEEGHISDLTEKIKSSVNTEETINEVIIDNVKESVKEILEDEIIKELVEQGQVKVIGAYYDFDGKVTFMEE